RWIIGDCTCDRNALLLSSAKLSGKMLRPVSEPNHADQLLCQFLIPSAITPSSQFHHQFHVLLGGQSRDEIVGLKDETYVCGSERRQRMLIRPVQIKT